MLPFLIELISGKVRSSLPRRLPVILPSDSSGQESHHSSLIIITYCLPESTLNIVEESMKQDGLSVFSI